MGGLTGPDASTGEKIASWALPIGAGLAAAVHPAGARGLAGVTSAINTGLYARQVNRAEEEDRALGRNVSNLLATPQGEIVNEGGTGRMFPPTLSEVIGRPQSDLIRTLAQSPGTAKAGATLLSTLVAPKH